MVISVIMILIISSPATGDGRGSLWVSLDPTLPYGTICCSLGDFMQYDQVIVWRYYSMIGPQLITGQ